MYSVPATKISSQAPSILCNYTQCMFILYNIFFPVLFHFDIQALFATRHNVAGNILRSRAPLAQCIYIYRYSYLLSPEILTLKTMKVLARLTWRQSLPRRRDSDPCHGHAKHHLLPLRRCIREWCVMRRIKYHIWSNTIHANTSNTFIQYNIFTSARVGCSEAMPALLR